MNIDIQKLEINVNLYAMQTEFLNLELHYVIAKNEDTFRFAGPEEEPVEGETKWYCFLQQKDLHIPAGDVLLKESYVVTKEPLYDIVSNCEDFVALIKKAKTAGVAKAIRQFTVAQLETIRQELQDHYATVDTHVVRSPQLQHYLFVVDSVEISVAPTMVYIRTKAPFSEAHYEAAKSNSKT